MTIAIGLISEGDIDYIIIPVLLERWLRTKGFRNAKLVIDSYRWRKRFRGFGAATKAALKLINSLKDKPDQSCHFYCVIIDERKTTDSISEIKKKKARTQVSDIKLGIPKPELEAWVMANHNNIANHFGIRSPLDASYKPEKEKYPKEVLKKMINDPNATCDYGHWGKDAALDIASCLDPNVIYNKCPSFKRFANKFLQNCRSVMSSKSLQLPI